MAIAVRVEEFSGTVVERLRAEVDVDSLCSFAAMDPASYPLLSGIAPYDDTCCNSRQALMLMAELIAVVQNSAQKPLQAAAMEVMHLASLLAAAPGRPHHRRLVFVGG